MRKSEATNPLPKEEEIKLDNALRPHKFEEFKGQQKIIEKFKVFIAAAKTRRAGLDHVLLPVTPGLGKTT